MGVDDAAAAAAAVQVVGFGWAELHEGGRARLGITLRERARGNKAGGTAKKQEMAKNGLCSRSLVIFRFCLRFAILLW